MEYAADQVSDLVVAQRFGKEMLLILRADGLIQPNRFANRCQTLDRAYDSYRECPPEKQSNQQERRGRDQHDAAQNNLGGERRGGGTADDDAPTNGRDRYVSIKTLIPTGGIGDSRVTFSII